MSTHARLTAFVAVADTGSIHAAAERIFLTDSSVSASVSALSRELGVDLLTRSGRGIAVTPAGATYAGYARMILGLHAEGAAAARGQLHPERGVVRIAAVTTAAEQVLPGALAGFRHRFSEVAISLRVGTRSEVWELLARHEVDLVIAGRPPAPSSLLVHGVRANDLVVVASPTLARSFVLATTTWLIREPGSGTRASAESLLTVLGAAPPRLELGSTGSAIAAAAAGLGVTLVSRDAAAPALETGALVEVPVPNTPLERPWHAVTNQSPSATTLLFVRHLARRRRGRGEPAWTAP